MNFDDKKCAELLLDYSLSVKENDLVVIKIENDLPQKLVKELYKQILLKNAYPVIDFEPSELREDFFSYANSEQLSFISPLSLTEYEKANKIIFINSSENINSLSKVDKNKLSLRTKSTHNLSQILMDRTSSGELNWVSLNYPTNAYAQMFNMSLEKYCELFSNVVFLSDENPVQKWNEVYSYQEFLINKLKNSNIIRVKGKDTDISFSLKGREWQNCAGKFNIPDGEICISPVENSANGSVYFDFPSYFRGQCVENIKLKFKNGKVVKASASKNEQFLLDMLNVDEGAKFLGEFAFGLNNNITYPSGNILFDEKIGGSIHFALGAGGMNQSSIHWDIVKNMKNNSEVYADKKLIYKNGEFCF